MSRVILVLLIAALPAGTAAAQSLADVARKERARRQDVKSGSRVITNKDLKPARGGAPPIPAPAAAQEATTDASPTDPEAPAAPTDEELAEQEEQAWRQKMGDARKALERNEMYLDALQSKINALWADFTARDDPAQRAKIEIERQRAVAESERVQTEIASQRTAIADLEEEARRAGVPPGWLR